MDAKKFGAFIAAVRKEQSMTQAQLAQKLQVTDKAVSKWERGLGFPDINSIEPLADALGLSVLEFMRSERINAPRVEQTTTSAALSDTLELVKQQRRAERKAMGIILLCAVSLLLLVFLIDSMGFLGFVLACLPVMCLLAGAALVVCGFYRKHKGLPCAQAFTLAAVTLLVPLALAAFFLLIGALGLGPVPV